MVALILLIGVVNYAKAEAVSAASGPAFSEAEVYLSAEDEGTSRILFVPEGAEGEVTFTSSDESVLSVEGTVLSEVSPAESEEEGTAYTFGVRYRVNGEGTSVITGKTEDGREFSCTVRVGSKEVAGTAGAEAKSLVAMQAMADLVGSIAGYDQWAAYQERAANGETARKVTGFSAEETAIVCRWYTGLSYSCGDWGQALRAAAGNHGSEAAMKAVIAKDVSSATTGAVTNAVKSGTQLLREVRFGAARTSFDRIRRRSVPSRRG